MTEIERAALKALVEQWRNFSAKPIGYCATEGYDGIHGTLIQCADELSALIAAGLSEASAPQWQPIKTAPSGTMILVCSMSPTIEAREWCFVDWLVNGDLIAHPRRSATHWMPLPASPAPQKEPHRED